MGDFGTKTIGGAFRVHVPKEEPPSPWDQRLAGHTADADLRELGLETMPVDAAAVMAAWRAQVKRTDTPGRDMDALKQVRDRLMLAIEGVNQSQKGTCFFCGGHGTVEDTASWSRSTCPVCKGTGQRP